MKEFEVVLFHKDNGESPVEEFIDTLEPKMQAKVLRTMELLKRNGLELREPYTKSLGRGIFELRVKHGTDISRVLYFFIASIITVISSCVKVMFAERLLWARAMRKGISSFWESVLLSNTIF